MPFQPIPQTKQLAHARRHGLELRSGHAVSLEMPDESEILRATTQRWHSTGGLSRSLAKGTVSWTQSRRSSSTTQQEGRPGLRLPPRRLILLDAQLPGTDDSPGNCAESAISSFGPRYPHQSELTGADNIWGAPHKPEGGVYGADGAGSSRGAAQDPQNYLVGSIDVVGDERAGPQTPSARRETVRVFMPGSSRGDSRAGPFPAGEAPQGAPGAASNACRAARRGALLSPRRSAPGTPRTLLSPVATPVVWAAPARQATPPSHPGWALAAPASRGRRTPRDAAARARAGAHTLASSLKLDASSANRNVLHELRARFRVAVPANTHWVQLASMWHVNSGPSACEAPARGRAGP
jgi:hypothetical protein